MIVALINPSACRSRGAEIAHAVAQSAPRIRLVVSDSEADVDELVASLIEDNAELLVLAGGDGTLLSLLTRFDAAGRLDQVPPLLVLPAGEMNTTARALVGLRKPEWLAPRILHAWTRGVRRLHRMPVLRLQVEGQPDRVGVTVSIGAVARIHRDYERSDRSGPPAVAELLLRFGLQQLTGEHFVRIDGPIHIDGQPAALPSMTAGVLSPLPGFFVGMRPFPGVRRVASDGFHVTLSDLGAYATQASLLAILRGHMPAGARLHYGHHRELSWQGTGRGDVVAIDGEMVPVAPGATVRVQQAGHVRILVWRSMPAPARDEPGVA